LIKFKRKILEKKLNVGGGRSFLTILILPNARDVVIESKKLQNWGKGLKLQEGSMFSY
jgi:hypothetical protein